MSAILDGTASHNTVTYFPADPREAWLSVQRYEGEMVKTKTYIAALNLQVARRHHQKVSQPRLATLAGAAVVHIHPDVTPEHSAPEEWG